MDFIERVFGISPDRGDGSSELLLFVFLLLLPVIFHFVSLLRKRSR